MNTPQEKELIAGGYTPDAVARMSQTEKDAAIKSWKKQELTEEQREQIASLSNNNLPDTVYIEWLSMYGDFDELDEAYAGEFRSDKDFAQDMADNAGDIPTSRASAWPLYCIDWEYAASELMHDYFEIDGYYFRQM